MPPQILVVFTSIFLLALGAVMLFFSWALKWIPGFYRVTKDFVFGLWYGAAASIVLVIVLTILLIIFGLLFE